MGYLQRIKQFLWPEERARFISIGMTHASEIESMAHTVAHMIRKLTRRERIVLLHRVKEILRCH